MMNIKEINIELLFDFFHEIYPNQYIQYNKYI